MPSSATPPPVDIVQDVVAPLERLYGVPQWTVRQDALSELIACVLSQHTSDTNSWRAFEDLKRLYPTWDAVLAAPPADIADAIRRGGLADVKARRIQAVLAVIQGREGKLDLSRLEGMPDDQARDFLMSLPGVGPKTAAIVLCFALSRPALPVDTHVFRVAWRLGLIEKRIGEGRAHNALASVVPREYVFRFHVALIQHGRAVCRAQRPKCAECPLADSCAFHQAQTAANPVS